MSLRTGFVKLFRSGRQVFEKFVSQRGAVRAREAFPKGKGGKDRDVYQQQGVQRCLPTQTQQTLVQRIIKNHYVNTLASQLRRKAALQFVGGGIGRNGRNVPLFMFVGLSLAAKQLRDEDKIDDCLCSEIRNIFCNVKTDYDDETRTGTFSLNNLEFGELINKGCDAAVYEARIKSTDIDDEITVIDEEDAAAQDTEAHTDKDNSDSELSGLDADDSDGDSFIILSTEDETEGIHDEDLVVIGSVSDNISCDKDDDFVVLSEDEDDSEANVDTDQLDLHSINFNLQDECSNVDVPQEDSASQFDLAVKVMFNYSIESDSSAIIQGMNKELVPAVKTEEVITIDTGQTGSHARLKKLPEHFNIVDVEGVFVDDVPELSKATEYFPDALPKRLHSEGLGRNKTMFLIMKRYTKTLREYLTSDDPSMYHRICLLTQLLDGVTHMRHNGISHRDLKSNNILVDVTGDIPHLVICDFGSCQADPNYGLIIPYHTNDISKGGNSALMAPEIKTAVPGPGSVLDYSKADLWSVGVLAYEIFGMDNPFYSSPSSSGGYFDSRTYREDELPSLPDDVPQIVRNLVSDLLKRESRERPSADVAANILHLYLWGPSRREQESSLSSLKLWILTFVTRFLCETCFKNSTPRYVEHEMKLNLLKRANLQNLSFALNYINNSGC